jgi:hypothetical protein
VTPSKEAGLSSRSLPEGVFEASRGNKKSGQAEALHSISTQKVEAEQSNTPKLVGVHERLGSSMAQLFQLRFYGFSQGGTLAHWTEQIFFV